MKYRKSLPQKLIDSWPGRKTFGVYRFLPLFFGLGACLEFCMINWTVGQTNFCKCAWKAPRCTLSSPFISPHRPNVQDAQGEGNCRRTSCSAACPRESSIIMPAGVSWGQYIGFTVSALVSMGLGAQLVHRLYRPLGDLDEYVEREYQRRFQQQDPKSELH